MRVVEAQELQPPFCSARSRRPGQIRDLGQLCRLVAAVKGETLDLIELLQRPQVGERIEIQGQVAEVLHAHRESARFKIRRCARNEFVELAVVKQVACKVQSGQVDGKLQTAKGGDAAPGSVERGNFAQVARQDALLVVVGSAERLVRARARAIHMKKRRPQVRRGDGNANRLGQSHAERPVRDDDGGIHRDSFGRDRAPLAARGQNPGLACRFVEVVHLHGLCNEVVPAALAPQPVKAFVAHDQVVAVSAPDAVAVRDGMDITLNGGVRFDDERDIRIGFT